MNPRVELAVAVVGIGASVFAMIGGSAVACRWVVGRLIDEKVAPLFQAISIEVAQMRASFDTVHVRDTLEDHGERIAATEARVEGIERRI